VAKKRIHNPDVLIQRMLREIAAFAYTTVDAVEPEHVPPCAAYWPPGKRRQTLREAARTARRGSVWRWWNGFWRCGGCVGRTRAAAIKRAWRRARSHG